MIRSIVILVFGVLLLSNMNSSSYVESDELLTVSNCKEFTSKYNSESLFLLEKLASEKFVELLKEYRLKKGKQEVVFDTTLWMASRNQLIYQLFDMKIADHYQSKKTSRFTGRTPMDRVKYVMEYRSLTIEYMTENCMSEGKFPRNNSDIEGVPFDEDDDIDEFAEMAASTAFEMWKMSKGHNANLLNPKSIYIGPAFIIRDNLIIATCVFADKAF